MCGAVDEGVAMLGEEDGVALPVSVAARSTASRSRTTANCGWARACCSATASPSSQVEPTSPQTAAFRSSLRQGKGRRSPADVVGQTRAVSMLVAVKFVAFAVVTSAVGVAVAVGVEGGCGGWRGFVRGKCLNCIPDIR